MPAAPRRWAAELLHVWFHDLRPADWWGGSILDRCCPPLGPIWPRYGYPRRGLLTVPDCARGNPVFDQVQRNLYRVACGLATDPLQGITREAAQGWIAPRQCGRTFIT